MRSLAQVGYLVRGARERRTRLIGGDTPGGGPSWRTRRQLAVVNEEGERVARARCDTRPSPLGKNV